MERSISYWQHEDAGGLKWQGCDPRDVVDYLYERLEGGKKMVGVGGVPWAFWFLLIIAVGIWLIITILLIMAFTGLLGPAAVYFFDFWRVDMAK